VEAPRRGPGENCGAGGFPSGELTGTWVMDGD
jgi:hypothetical protein